MAAIEAVLEELKPILPRGLGVGLPAVKGRPAVAGRIVTMTRDSLSFGGTPFERSPAGFRRLRRELKRGAKSGKLIYLFADHSIAVGEAYKVFDVMPKGSQPALAVYLGTPFPIEKVKPTTAWGKYVLRQRQELRSSERTEFITASLAASIGTCAAAVEAVNPKKLQGWDPSAQIREGLLAGARSCKCEGLDIDGLGVGILMSFSSWSTTGYLLFEKLEGLADDATVADLAKALAAKLPEEKKKQ